MTRTKTLLAGLAGLAAVALVAPHSNAGVPPTPSVARQWNDLLLDAIRGDFARPTVHARNLHHTSMAMWDAWATFEPHADPVLTIEPAPSVPDVQAAREEAISYAMYRILSHRFSTSPGAPQATFDAKMAELGYDTAITTLVPDTPAGLGNLIAFVTIGFGAADNANEVGGYINQFYVPVNPPLLPDFPGNPDLVDPGRWQPLALEWFQGQSGIIVEEYPEALSPEWGIVTPFALSPEDLTVYQRDGFDWWVYHDPGPPPYLGTATDAEYKAGFEQVVEFSSLLDATDGSTLDISPAALGNNTLGTNDGSGYALNPVTGLPYTPQVVPAGDYYRILAEFWADGPDSETPPGHWFTLANYVSDHSSTVKRIGGEGPILDDLEWDVSIYLALGGAMHDAAVASWGVKGWYDYIRPVSAIRHLCDLGQCTDPGELSYDPGGINLHPGFIEVVTPTSSAPGQRHEHLAASVGKIAIKAWRETTFIVDPDVDTAGVGWILAESWWPYQRPSFVTPPFPGYVSGHSTYSRCAAELLTLFTGSPYFPDGLGEFHCPQNEFLVFEDGPSVDVTLQWASYGDAADECSLSRIYGGIHPRADDTPGRLMGAVIGPDAFYLALRHLRGRISCPADLDGSGVVDTVDLLAVLSGWGTDDRALETVEDGSVNVTELLDVLGQWGACP